MTNPSTETSCCVPCDPSRSWGRRHGDLFDEVRPGTVGLVSPFCRTRQADIDAFGKKSASELPLSIFSQLQRLRRDLHHQAEGRNAMEYLCLVYLDEKRMAGLPKEEMAAIDRASMEYDDELRRRGHLIAARALAEPRTAMTVRPRTTGASTTAGPFVETKEHLGGFILIEARD